MLGWSGHIREPTLPRKESVALELTVHKQAWTPAHPLSYSYCEFNRREDVSLRDVFAR